MNSKWDKRFYNLALHISEWSYDKTKVGCVLVKDKRIISTAFNGFPTGLDDNLSLYKNRKTKLDRVVHAEANTIIQCALNGISSKGCTLYTTKYPCIDCSKLIISAGVVRVVTSKIKKTSKWYENNLKSKLLLQEAKIDIKIIEDAKDKPTNQLHKLF